MHTRFIIVCLLLVLGHPALAAGDDPFTALEKRLGGRLGVTAIDTGTDHRVTHRGSERFRLCSTFKLLLAAHILHRVDEGKEAPTRVIPYGPADLLDYAPITKKHVHEKGLPVADLCAAAVQHSDNTAANLLLKTQGGPAGLTAYLRTTGDHVTHLDRGEPALNDLAPGKDLDTTTPDAMAETIRRLVLGTILSPASRARLEAWLLGNTTGDARLKAGLPAGWRIADKTGTGPDGATNDVGILYPPHGRPIVIAAYITDAKGPRADSEAALADVARLVVARLAAENAPKK